MASSKRRNKMSNSTKEEQPPKAAEAVEMKEVGEAERMQTHQDLVTKAREDRARQEANRRLNTIHEIEMQIKTQQSRQPDQTIKDDKGRTWEDYHDIFWQAKRGVIYKDDPMNLNRHLAQYLGQEREIAWMDES